MLEINRVGFRFPRGRQDQVISNVSMLVESGEIAVIVGPSGCGKTTLLNLISGILHPSSGRIAMTATGVGYVFQSASLVPWRTVWKNVMLGAELRGLVSNDEVSRRAHALVNAYGLSGFEECYPSTLSGGMQQRVAIIRAIVGGAMVLLLDEPFSDSDFLMRRSLQDDLSRAVDEEQLAAILVTHDLEEAVRLGDKVIVLTSRPARVAGEVRIPIPRRDRNHDKWVMDRQLMPYLEQVWAVLDNCGASGLPAASAGGR